MACSHVGRSLGPQLWEAGSRLAFLAAEGDCRASTASEGRVPSLAPCFLLEVPVVHILAPWARVPLPRRPSISPVLSHRDPPRHMGSAGTTPVSLIRRSECGREVTPLRSADIWGGGSAPGALASERPARVPAFTPVSCGGCELCLRSPHPPLP